MTNFAALQPPLSDQFINAGSAEGGDLAGIGNAVGKGFRGRGRLGQLLRSNCWWSVPNYAYFLGRRFLTTANMLQIIRNGIVRLVILEAALSL